jgi:hypothetical protein
MRFRRKPKVDREQFPHVYTGPKTWWGLESGAACKIVGSRAGGRRIQTVDGSVYTVGRDQVIPWRSGAEQPA